MFLQTGKMPEICPVTKTSKLKVYQPHQKIGAKLLHIKTTISIK